MNSIERLCQGLVPFFPLIHREPGAPAVRLCRKQGLALDNRYIIYFL
jgi:hypothetical protein